MQALPAGGELWGRSLVAGDADIETGGGDIEIGKLMGTFVHVSTEDTEVSNDACGAMKCGAIYADNLHLITGERGPPEFRCNTCHMMCAKIRNATGDLLL